MVKYKLIKEYPASPPLGTEINECGYDRMTTWCNPEKYPEFWEKIDEKAYKVLSFIGKVIPRIYKLQDNGNYLCEEDKQYYFTNENAFKLLNHNDGGLDIHSIKRLSDNEIFTIYDKIFPNNKIHKFELKNDILTIWHCDIKFSCPVIKGPSNQPGNCSWIKNIDNLKKLKQPLFTTEDGVDIFEDDNIVYEVIDSNFHLNEKIPLRACNNINFKTINTSKIFSTREKAEEYVLKNKPIFSYNDIEEIAKSFYPLNVKLLKKIKNKAKKIIFEK